MQNSRQKQYFILKQKYSRKNDLKENYFLISLLSNNQNKILNKTYLACSDFACLLTKLYFVTGLSLGRYLGSGIRGEMHYLWKLSHMASCIGLEIELVNRFAL